MGKHVNPRRNLSATPEEFERWDRVALDQKRDWSAWVRDALNKLAERWERKKEREQT